MKTDRFQSLLWLLIALWLLSVSWSVSWCHAESPRNFTGDAELSRAAESARERSARFWSGQPLPGDWYTRCPIVWEAQHGSGSGKTRFVFADGEVSDWSMRVSGTREAVLKDVLPHEVDHAVRATLCRRPLPRWLDEGCSTLMESTELHELLRKQQRDNPGRLTVADLDRLEYPASLEETQRLYASGFSLTEYLLEQGGPERLLAMQSSRQRISHSLAQHYQKTPAEILVGWQAWESRRLASGCDCVACGCRLHGGPRPVPRTISSAIPLAVDPRPELTVWSAPGCGPCQQFLADLGGPLRALSREYRVIVYDFTRDRAGAQRAGVTEVPTFTLGEIRVIGYRGPERLLAELGLANPRPRPPTLIDERDAPEVDPRPAPAQPKPVEAIIEPLPSKAAEAAPGASGSGWWQWGLSGWQLALAIAAAAGTGGLLTPAVIWPAVRFGWRTITGLRRLRKSRSERATTDSEPPGGEVRGHAPFPRHLDEARELLRLRQQEGRVAALDAIRGMALDDAAQIILDSPQTTEAEKVAVRKLMTQIDQQVDEIAPISTRP